MYQSVQILAALVRHAMTSWHHTARFCLVLLVAGLVLATAGAI